MEENQKNRAINFKQSVKGVLYYKYSSKMQLLKTFHIVFEMYVIFMLPSKIKIDRLYLKKLKIALSFFLCLLMCVMSQFWWAARAAINGSVPPAIFLN